MEPEERKADTIERHRHARLITDFAAKGESSLVIFDALRHAVCLSISHTQVVENLGLAAAIMDVPRGTQGDMTTRQPVGKWILMRVDRAQDGVDLPSHLMKSCFRGGTCYGDQVVLLSLVPGHCLVVSLKL